MPVRARSVLAGAIASVLVLILWLPGGASAKPVQMPIITVPQDLQQYVPRVSAVRAFRTAEGTASVRIERKRHPDLRPSITIYRDTRDWAIAYYTGKSKVVDIKIDGETGRIIGAWHGIKAAWPMARGQRGYFGRVFQSWYVWIPLCLLFVLPFFDPRRPFRLLHLDLLVLVAGFGVSHFFFNRGEIGTSVPLVYPVLAYLLARLAIAGFRPRRPTRRLIPLVPASWLVVAIVLLIGVRIGLNVTSSHAGDVAWGSTIGAYRVEHGAPLYANGGVEDTHGDTYGPVTYLAYVPFVKAFPPPADQAAQIGDYKLPAAHAAAIFFDLMTALGLFLLGTRLRRGAAGRMLGLALTYAWVSYPYTLFSLMSNTNDLLIAMLLVYSLVAISSPRARGAILGLAAAAKFAPLALAPLFASGRGESRARSWTFFGVAFGVVVAALLLPFIPRDGGLHTFWSQTIGFQLSRQSPFSIWGQNPGLETAQALVKVGAVAFAVAVAFVPRRRSAVQVAALGAAVLIAAQLTAVHWFYFYIVWFVPFAFVALFCEQTTAYASESEPERAADLAVPAAVDRRPELVGAG
jgi:Glycosyltransferase family 87